MTQTPIADGLFVTEGEDVHLIASTSSTSEFLIFPAEPGQEELQLASEGTLYTWTSQEFRPPAPPYVGPEDFTRFGVGYVEFPEGILVEGVLTSCDPDVLTIGQTMRTVLIPFGDSVSFGFEPIGTPNNNPGLGIRP